MKRNDLIVFNASCRVTDPIIPISTWDTAIVEQVSDNGVLLRPHKKHRIENRLIECVWLRDFSFVDVAPIVVTGYIGDKTKWVDVH